MFLKYFIIFNFLIINLSCSEKVFDIKEKILKFNEESALKFKEKNSICLKDIEKFGDDCEFLYFF